MTLVLQAAADPGGEIALLAISLALDAALLLAMQRSRRFRVTFEHRARSDRCGLGSLESRPIRSARLIRRHEIA